MITPQIEVPEIAHALGLDRTGARLYVKREDLHPYGSHKGRSIPFMIDSYGGREFVVSSSGNAALAAIRHIQKLNETRHGKDKLKLSVLIGEHINEAKKAALLAEVRDPEHIVIEQESRPLQTLFRMIKAGGIMSLRQSTDDKALMGYKTLAAEIMPTPDLDAVFVPASSGTTAQAIAEFFHSEKRQIPVHIVQTESVSPLAEEFDQIENPRVKSGAEPSIADAIIDRVAHRKTALVKAIHQMNGWGWIVSDDDIREAQRLLAEEAHIDATPNGALALAGLIRALKSGRTFKGGVVVILTGK